VPLLIKGVAYIKNIVYYSSLWKPY